MTNNQIAKLAQEMGYGAEVLSKRGISYAVVFLNRKVYASDVAFELDIPDELVYQDGQAVVIYGSDS